MKQFALLALLLINIQCSDTAIRYHGNEQLYTKFFKAIQPPLGKENCGTYRLDLAQVASFAWDSVYFFPGESGPIYISNVIGFKWDGLPVPNLYNRLLFVYEGKVVTYIDCPRFQDEYKGDVSLSIQMLHCNTVRPVLSRNQARFVVSHFSESQFNNYPLVPISCFDNLKRFLLPKCSEN